MNKRELGKKRVKEILGEQAEGIIKNFEEISPDFANYILEFAYGDIYARPGFSDMNRELAAVACLIGQGNTGLPLQSHFIGMLNVGWTKDDIIELLIFLTGYVGFPSCVEAIMALQQTIEKRDKKG